MIEQADIDLLKKIIATYVAGTITYSLTKDDCSLYRVLSQYDASLVRSTATELMFDLMKRCRATATEPISPDNIDRILASVDTPQSFD